MGNLVASSLHREDGDFHGHAMCLSCPPEGFALENPKVDWDAAAALDGIDPVDLTTLFMLSDRLQLEGELTPIAWVAPVACRLQLRWLTQCGERAAFGPQSPATSNLSSSTCRTSRLCSTTWWERSSAMGMTPLSGTCM